MWEFIKTSQLVRGAVSAMALLTFLSQYLPFAVLDLATLVHQIILRWNDITADVGAFISTLLGAPDIPSEIVNAVIIGLSLGPVWSYSILKSEWGTHRGIIQNAAFWVRAAIGCLDGFFAAMIAIIFGSGPFFYAAIATLLILTVTVLARLPAYRKGFIFALGALIFVEGIYYFSSPAVQSAFDSFICGGTESNAPRCQSVTQQ
ncbi:hypothetical protein [Salipiger sp. PrR007]|uniref:hypothetical protein n=1 Tax=Salipiger sp. PrR007 TaxID=2706884 RepID=UPI0013B64D21|nr:hypothetical protein [Salipiger sp. PrR007]NDW34934.1 hypothetical protein [Salipiger sp. PrR007]